MRQRPFSPRCEGFTLVEMLIALSIVALALAGATLALRPDEARQLSAEAERLALLLGQAREESALGGRALAWVAAEDGYGFQRREVTRRGPDWTEMNGDELFHLRRFPDGVNVRRIEADGQRLGLGERLDLGPLGARQVAIALTLGGETALIRSADDGFEVKRLADTGS